MLLNRLVFTAALSALVVLTGCDVPTVESPVDGLDTISPESTDTGAPPTTDGDAVPDIVVEAETTSAPESEFVIGVNVTGKNTPEFFSELPENGDLFVELGAQGLWMVVLAFKTYGYFDGKVLLRSWIEVAGERVGELALAKQKLLPGGDGWDYYYNFFLVVPDPALAGQEAQVTLQVEDDETQEIVVVIERNVTLTGGEP